MNNKTTITPMAVSMKKQSNTNTNDFIMNKKTNYTTTDSSNQSFPYIHNPPYSKLNTEKEFKRVNKQRKKCRNIPKCTLWTEGFNQSINVSTLYNMNKTNYSSYYTKATITNHLNTNKVRLNQTKAMPLLPLNKKKRIDHFIKLNMKKCCINEISSLNQTANEASIKKINSIKVSINFWKGVLNASLPIILTEKFVYNRNNEHK